MTSYQDNSAYRTLVVEDHLISRRYISEALRRCGWAVKHCRSAEEALPVCKQWHPQLVITDLHLPGAGGFELAEQLAQHAGTGDRQTTMLLVSAQTSPALEQQAYAAGFAGLLRKPLDFNQLCRLVSGRAAGREPHVKEDSRNAEPPAESVMHPDGNLMNLFRAELQARLPEIEEFILCGRLAEAASVAHQLTASAAICGKLPLEERIRDFNAACRQPPDVQRLAMTFTRFHRCAHDVVECQKLPSSG